MQVDRDTEILSHQKNVNFEKNTKINVSKGQYINVSTDGLI